MNTLFIANIELNENEGIYKKILAQAEGLKKANTNGWLLTKKGKGCLEKNLQNETSFKNEINILEAAKNLVSREKVDVVYIRHMLPSTKLISLLKWLKKNHVFIFYEIPTYPYYAEQFRTSNKKYRAIAKLTIDSVFWPFIYANIDKLVVIKSRTNIRMYKKMVEITNGADVESIVPKNYLDKTNDSISLVTVGTLYPYHGYDRVIKGLAQYNKKDNVIPVEFHIIGASPTIENLKDQAKQEGVENVFFHGVKTTEELNEMMDCFDIGLGSVALHRRNADIDTTIKVIEYYCRGMVVATSGKSPMDSYDAEVTIHIQDNEEPIDIEKLIAQYKAVDSLKKQSIACYARKVFSWDFIMKQLCKEYIKY